MTQILFIIINDITAMGVRMLSASLRQAGYKPYIIFLKNPSNVTATEDYKMTENIQEDDWVGINRKGEVFKYSVGAEVTTIEKNILLSLIEEIKPDIIGFSATTPLMRRITEISKLVRSKFDIPIIFGGPHPTVDFKDCLNYCDFVCIGEGEKTIVDIAKRIDNKEDIREVNNLVYLDNGQYVQNPLYPLVSNLDELPFMDISADDKFLIENDSLVREFSEFGQRRGKAYTIASSRGCPYKCSYCCEDFYKNLYSNEKFLRRRTPANVIKELKEAKKIIDYDMIHFEDEVFSLDIKWLREFADIYKKEINLPFVSYIFPNNNIDNQLKILKEIGLLYTCLAVQSGSESINKDVFTRPFNKELYIKTANILKSMEIAFYTDVITYNPFETEKDLQDTLDVLNQLPKPFGICVNKLYILKGTKIYDLVADFKANKNNKILSDEIFNYYSRLFWLTIKCNKQIVKFVQNRQIFKSYPSLIPYVLNICGIIGKIKKILDMPITKFIYKLKLRLFKKKK